MTTTERKDRLEKLLAKSYDLLTKYERIHNFTTDPLQQEQLKFSVGELKTGNAALEAELNGGPVVPELDLLAFEALLGNVSRVAQTIIQAQNSQVNINSVVNNYQPRTRTLPKPPAPPPVFGGREKQLAELKEKLATGQNVGVTAVQGLGGIGKTTLANQAANELYNEGKFKAVLYASLGREANPLTLLSAWAYYADPDFTAGDIPLDQLTGLIRSKLQDLINQEGGGGPVLVLLDDIWEKSLPVARRLLQAAPTPATTLITSRAAKVVTDLGAKQRISLERLAPAEGVALLGEYLPGVSLLARHALTTVLDGYTLAVTLAAKRALDDNETNPAAALPRHVAQYADALREGTPFGKLELERSEEKEDNLTATLYLSYADLSPEEQAAFRALGVLAYDEPFDLPMLAAIWQLDADTTARRAKRLRLLSLLQNETQLGEGWYSQHPVLHSYARAFLKHDQSEYATTLARYEAHAITLAAPFRELPPQDWKQLDPYLPHIHAAGDELVAHTRQFFEGVERAAQTETEWKEELAWRALAFANNITRYLEHRREVRKREWLDIGLAATQRLYDREREGLFLGELGVFCKAAGQMTQALHYFERALQARRETKNRLNEATILNNLGSVYGDLGQMDKALQYYEQALPILREVGDRSVEATTLNNIGALYDALGHKDKALEYFEQALPIHIEVGNRSVEASTLNNIGAVYRSIGQAQKALKYFEQALPILREVGNRSIEAITLNNIGAVYYDLGQMDKALQYYEQALPLRRAASDRRGEASTLNNIGAVYYASGEYDKALLNMKQVLTIVQEVGDRFGEALFWSNIGWVYKAMGKLVEAVKWQARCIEIMEQVQHPNLERYRATLEEWRAKLVAGGETPG